MKRYIIANWKAHLNLAEAMVLAQAVKGWAGDYPQLQIILAPSLPWLVPLEEALNYRPANLTLASQVVSAWPEGAYTGDVAACQLKKIVSHCLVGHSERRRFHHETSTEINGQIHQLLASGITPVICFGEAKQNDSRRLITTITQGLAQDLHGLSTTALEQCLLAYEPLWAIGTGTSADPGYIDKVVTGLHQWFQDTYQAYGPILYGGSVTADNAHDLGSLNGLSGLLVGGASLKAQEFEQICAQYSQSL